MPTPGLARPLASLLLVAALLLLSPAAAAAEGYELEWEVDAGCPDQTAALRMLHEHLGSGSASRDLGGDARVEVRIERQDDRRFRAEVEVEVGDEHGERTFGGDSCRDVAEAAALIAAMLLDPAAVVSRAPPAAEPPSRPTWLLGVHVLGDSGSLPRLTPGGGLSFGLGIGPLHAGLRATALLPQRTERGPSPVSGGELVLYAGSARAGFELVRGLQGHVSTGPSAALELGMVVGRGLGLADKRTTRQLWLAPGLGWALWVTASAFSLALSAEVLAPLHRPSWTLDDYGELFRAPTAAGRLSLELGWLLPWP